MKRAHFTNDAAADFFGIAKLAFRERRAKLAYEAWVFTARFSREDMPFEHLTRRTIEAWKAVVQALDAEPECRECGAALTCEKCKEQTK
jgi:hypothetical protein